MQLPASLLQSLNGVKGFDKDAFEEVHDSGMQVTSIRLNPSKPLDKECGPSKIFHERIPWCPHSYYLSSRPSFTLDPTFHAGAYYVQEASSMFLWQVLEQTIGKETQGLRVLDLCAAPGGKSTLLASYFTNGLVVSNEVIKTRASVLTENITKWGADNVIVTNNDPAHFKSLINFFDVIVVDAPCSGSGLFRKDNNAVDEWSENNVNLCSLRQQRIVADVLPSLKENGLLIYSTCSYSTQENEAILDTLVIAHDMETCKLTVDKSSGIVETVSAQQNAYGYRFYPYLVKGEGFFIAALRKKNGGFTHTLKEQQLPKLSRDEKETIESFIGKNESVSFFKQGESVKMIPEQFVHSLQVIAQHLYIKKAGIEVGTIKRKDMIPHHELALSGYQLTSFNAIALNETQALQYLRRKEVIIDAPVGWSLVTYCGLNLGWVKVLPNRVNNYYPQEWRILKD